MTQTKFRSYQAFPIKRKSGRMINFSHIPLIFLLSTAVMLGDSLGKSIVDPSKVRTISWKPRAFVYEGFLTDEECEHLISVAKNRLTRSAVVDREFGKGMLSKGRTSSGTPIPRGNDSIVAGIEEKIYLWTFYPEENGEDLLVLRYDQGQKYDAHHDYFVDKVNIARAGQRIATVLMYLTDVDKGGETVFPVAEESPRVPTDQDFSACGRKGPAVKPRKGDALLFFNLHPDTIPDVTSGHAGCPVDEGEKWSATKWIHVDVFQ